MRGCNMASPQYASPSFPVALIATRRVRDIAAMMSPGQVTTYLLHEMVASPNMSLDEFARYPLIVIEVPPLCLDNFEKTLSKLVHKFRDQGSQVALMVQPSLRKQTHRSLCMQRRNKMQNVPFLLKKI